MHEFIQGNKPEGQQCNQLLNAVVTIIKYKIIKFYHAIYIKVISRVNVSYLTVFTDDVMNTNNYETDFLELRKVF